MQKVASSGDDEEPLEPFGDLIPFGDPVWYQGVRFNPGNSKVPAQR